jgi:hypothetical protein
MHLLGIWKNKVSKLVVRDNLSGVKVGDRVVWLRESPYSNESGRVKWIGVIEGEEIAGIEFVSRSTPLCAEILIYYCRLLSEF